MAVKTGSRVIAVLSTTSQTKFNDFQGPILFSLSSTFQALKRPNLRSFAPCSRAHTFRENAVFKSQGLLRTWGNRSRSIHTTQVNLAKRAMRVIILSVCSTQTGKLVTTVNKKQNKHGGEFYNE